MQVVARHVANLLQLGVGLEVPQRLGGILGACHRPTERMEGRALHPAVLFEYDVEMGVCVPVA